MASSEGGHTEQMGSMVAQWLALLPHSVRELGSIPARVTVCVEFAGSPRVDVGFLWGLRFSPKDVRMRSIGHAKLPFSVRGLAG